MNKRKRRSMLPECPVPCREAQFEDLSRTIQENIVQEGSKCIYISGVPGTGKTLIVNSVLEGLKKENTGTPEFSSVYVNGLTLGCNPDKIWKVLWNSLSGTKEHSKKALDKLTKYFETQGSEPVVLVVDELDQLMDKRQSVLYRLLEWTNNPQSKFTFIAIFNTMNLPESALVNRNASRMGLSRITFPPYDALQLQTIVESWLQKSKTNKAKLNQDALVLLSKKVAAISGDARRALEIAKPTLHKLENSNIAGAKAVDEAFKELFSTPKVEFIRNCSALEKAVLEAAVNEFRRTGDEEICFGPVETALRTTATYEGKNWSRDTIAAALVRLATLKLLIIESTDPYTCAFTKISMNISSEDVKFALNAR